MLRRPERKGLIIVHTGSGKGKTTAALGLALRGVGYGFQTLMIQFIKGSWKYGELDAAEMLAICSRGTPRVANRLLRRMRDFAQVRGNGTIRKSVVEEGLGRLRIDTEGLEEQDRRILSVIIDAYGGGPVGAETLAISVGEGIDSLEDFYEPYLIQRGFLQRTPRGRMATERAYRHLGRKADGGADQPLLL